MTCRNGTGIAIETGGGGFAFLRDGKRKNRF